MQIHTERLTLRPWSEADAPALFRYAQDPEVGPIAGWPVHTSVEFSRQIIHDVLSAPETYAVVLRSTGEPIGSIGLIPPAQTHTQVGETELELGYWVGKPHWGNGYIPEACRALVARAFIELGCTALWCGYYDGNVKSARCQEKVGFTYHHTEPDKPCELMGDVRTEHYTRLTRDQWEQTCA
ncbi:MAG: GNAT family N-acetyltransferase [Coriobacteriia bacterium]|nr:GNAT family N-acetyltransferase [Coriobacteriia bacterium]